MDCNLNFFILQVCKIWGAMNLKLFFISLTQIFKWAYEIWVMFYQVKNQVWKHCSVQKCFERFFSKIIKRLPSYSKMYVRNIKKVSNPSVVKVVFEFKCAHWNSNFEWNLARSAQFQRKIIQMLQHKIIILNTPCVPSIFVWKR